MRKTSTSLAWKGLATLAAASGFFIMSTLQSPAKPPSHQTRYFVYLGTYGKGVYGFRFDAGTGAMEPLGVVGEVVNPSFLATDRDFRYLYAVSELEGKVNGAVASFSIDRKTGKLDAINSEGSGGEAPCHLSVDQTSKTVVVANYGTGAVSAYPVGQDGRLGAISALMTAEGSGPNKERQEGPHAHAAVIAAGNERVYVPDLGLDRIRIYRLDPAHGKLVPNDPPFVKGPPGLGPRHIVFDSKAKFAYVLNELKPVVEVYAVDPANGNLTLVQSVATLPAGSDKENTGAEIRLHPNGRFLYTSNRGYDNIQVFAVDSAKGTLQEVESVPAGGPQPRGFDLDPTGQYLFAGSQKSGKLVVFKVDEKTGKLTQTGKEYEVPSPVDVLFVPAA